jgi:hypothetical protein
VTLLMMSTAPSKSTQTAGLNLAGWPLFITRQKSARLRKIYLTVIALLDKIGECADNVWRLLAWVDALPPGPDAPRAPEPLGGSRFPFFKSCRARRDSNSEERLVVAANAWVPPLSKSADAPKNIRRVVIRDSSITPDAAFPLFRLQAGALVDSFDKLAIPKDQDTIHHHILDTFRVLTGIFKGGFIDHAARIEHNQVRVRAGLDSALVPHCRNRGLQALSRHQCHLVARCCCTATQVASSAT